MPVTNGSHVLMKFGTVDYSQYPVIPVLPIQSHSTASKKVDQKPIVQFHSFLDDLMKWQIRRPYSGRFRTTSKVELLKATADIRQRS